jgi:predicted alpha/beta hydrolase
MKRPSTQEASALHAAPEPIDIPADDGYVLHGHYWRHAEGAGRGATPLGPVPVVVINPATSVASRYYGRFARFLQAHGMDVLTYDYRGIALSRPPRLRGFEAGWLIWGERDFEAVLQWLRRHCPGQPVDVVGHSVGGFVTGLAPSAPQRLHRICMVAAQVGYWADYTPSRRTAMFWKWQGVMPLVTALCGYFPGKRLGWLEDTPRGVVYDWTQRLRRYERAWDRGRPSRFVDARRALMEHCGQVRAPILSIGLEDDPFGTVRALERLLQYYGQSRRIHVRVAPDALGVTEVGHFAFFHDRFTTSLWHLALEWLRAGQLTEAMARRAPYTLLTDRYPG